MLSDTAAMVMYTKEVVEAIDKIVLQDTTQVGILTIMTELLDYLSRNNISYSMPVHSDLILVHPENRGRLGINAHNCHRNMKNIVAIGANRKLLNMSVAFELSGKSDDRWLEIDFNKRLVEGAKGLLAPHQR